MFDLEWLSLESFGTKKIKKLNAWESFAIISIEIVYLIYLYL